MCDPIIDRSDYVLLEQFRKNVVDEYLKNKWASLLANAANPNYRGDIRIKYVEILKELSPVEALFLDVIFNEYVNLRIRSYQSLYLKRTEPDFLCEYLQISNLEYYIIADNLIRLNLCSPEPTTPMSLYNLKNSVVRFFIPKIGIVSLKGKRIYRPTILGMDFVRSCRFDYGNKFGMEEKEWIEKVSYYIEELSKFIKRAEENRFGPNEIRKFYYDTDLLLSDIIEKYGNNGFLKFEYIEFKRVTFWVLGFEDNLGEDKYSRGLSRTKDILLNIRDKLKIIRGE